MGGWVGGREGGCISACINFGRQLLYMFHWKMDIRPTPGIFILRMVGPLTMSYNHRPVECETVHCTRRHVLTMHKVTREWSTTQLNSCSAISSERSPILVGWFYPPVTMVLPCTKVHTRGLTPLCATMSWKAPSSPTESALQPLSVECFPHESANLEDGVCLHVSMQGIWSGCL